MLMVDDVGIHLIDLPPISSSHPIPWMSNAIQPAHGALLVVDVSQAGCVAAVEDLIEILAERKIHLVPDWPRGADDPTDPDDPFVQLLPTVLVAARSNEISDVEDELATLNELLELDLPTLQVSVDDFDHVGPWLFDALGIVRVYTHSAVKKDDRPYTIRRGQTVLDAAGLVHKDFAENFQYARLIRAGEPDRQVGRDFELTDGDRIEIHA